MNKLILSLNKYLNSGYIVLKIHCLKYVQVWNYNLIKRKQIDKNRKFIAFTIFKKYMMK